MQIKYEIYQAGACRHPERITIKDGVYSPVSFPALCFALHHPTKGIILFDTGFSSRFAKICKKFPERLYNMLIPVRIEDKDDFVNQLKRRARINPQDVYAIFLSHFHVDHIAGLLDFANAKIICSKEGYGAIRNLGKVSALLHGFSPDLLPADFFAKASFVEDAPQTSLAHELSPFDAGYDVFEDGSIYAIPLPGHTKGQYGLFFKEANDAPVFLIADACWSSKAYREYKKPHFITSLVHHNWKMYCETLLKLHQLYKRRKNIVMIPSHCREFARDV